MQGKADLRGITLLYLRCPAFFVFSFFMKGNAKMEIEPKKYLSANKLSKVYGIPNNMIRKDIRTGEAPGFFSGSWFYIDVPAYLMVLNKRRKETKGA